jgi:nucleoside 2-deoxyribosyltransferase
MDAPAARPRCYVASALGFSEAGAHYYEHVYLPALREVVTPIDPWSLTTAQEVAEARAGRRERDFALEIGRRNADAIRTCTLLVAHLEGQEVDSGTAAEIGFGAALGLRCFGLRTDLRQSGEPGVSVNLQVEHFLVASGGELCDSLEGLVHRLTKVENESTSV